MGTAGRKKISKSWLSEKNNSIDESNYFELSYNKSESRQLLYLETLVWRMAIFHKMSTKKLQKIFFNFEVLKQPSEYRKTVKLDWNKTSEQDHITQKQFQPNL